MSRKAILTRWVAVFAIAATGLLVGEAPLKTDGYFVAPAHAIIGRPGTPRSYAGVARRTTRRAYGAGVASGRRCTRVVDAYGRSVTRCY